MTISAKTEMAWYSVKECTILKVSKVHSIETQEESLNK